MTQPFDQQRYEALRLQLVDRNEANVQNMYLDVLGIPTAGLGVAMTARQSDRSWELNSQHINALGDVLNLSMQQRQQLNGLLDRQLAVQNRHVDERHNTLRDFLDSDFGRESSSVLGPMINTRHNSPSGVSYSWDVLTSPQSPMQLNLTHQQSLDLFNRVAPEFETRVNAALHKAKCPQEALSEEQRAAVYSMVYQGASGKAVHSAQAIGDYWRGSITEDQLKARLQHTVHDPAFPERSRNELEYLDHIRQRPELQQAQPGQDSSRAGHVYQAGTDISADAVVAALEPKDRSIYDRIRSDAPHGVSDDVALQATADLKQAGLTNAQSIEKIALHNGALFITSNHTAGYAHSKTMVEGHQHDAAEAAQQIEQVNQQQQQQNLAFQQQQQSQSQTMSMS
ncbi:hypothetical protein [Solilutibacter silvestris]|uniref:hypothetical protein n=1 Tax=Solilutibacter silvestris TaxID=1645665 RepID=UPI003D32ADD1